MEGKSQDLKIVSLFLPVITASKDPFETANQMQTALIFAVGVLWR